MCGRVLVSRWQSEVSMGDRSRAADEGLAPAHSCPWVIYGKTKVRLQVLEETGQPSTERGGSRAQQHRAFLGARRKRPAHTLDAHLPGCFSASCLTYTCISLTGCAWILNCLLRP